MQVVGNGKRGFVDGDARDAEMNRPSGVCSLRDGTLVFTDAHNNAVRFVVQEDVHSKARRRFNVKTVEQSGLLMPKGIAASEDERHLFVCDTGHHKIKLAALPSRSALTGVDEIAGGVEMFAFAGSGKKGWRDGPALECSFNSPAGVCEYVDGTIIVADTGNHCIRQIRRTANGKLTVKTIAGGYAWMPTKKNDSQRRGASTRLSGHQDGTQALFRSPSAVVAGRHGEILVADTMNNCIRALLPPKIGRSIWEVHTICGQTRPGYTDGNCKIALFDQPIDLCWDVNGDGNSFFVADKGNACIRQIGRRYETFGDCMSFTWVRTIEVCGLPQESRSIRDQETLEYIFPLSIACLPQQNTNGEYVFGLDLVVCDGTDNIIKLLPFEEITKQTLETNKRSITPKLLETRAVSSALHSKNDRRTYAESASSVVTEPTPSKKSCASPSELSENQFESDSAVCSCECSSALVDALEANAALKAENIRLKELLESTFQEIELADKRFSENFQPQID